MSPSCQEAAGPRAAEVSSVPWRSGALPPSRYTQVPPWSWKQLEERREWLRPGPQRYPVWGLWEHTWFLFTCLFLRAPGEPFLRLFVMLAAECVNGGRERISVCPLVPRCQSLLCLLLTLGPSLIAGFILYKAGLQ